MQHDHFQYFSKWVDNKKDYAYEKTMMQEHPFFSKGQIFYGKANDDEEWEDDEELILPWNISLGEIQTKPNDKIGVFFFWVDPDSTDEIHFP